MSAKLAIHERIIVLLDSYPWSALYRVGLGYLLPLLYYRISSEDNSGLMAILWFLSLLIGLRLFPAILRKLLPFSREVQAVWAERRQAAKRYDSYQWRKLLWFGIGIACYMGVSGRIWNSLFGVLAVFCMIGGGVGIILWRNKRINQNVIVDS